MCVNACIGRGGVGLYDMELSNNDLPPGLHSVSGTPFFRHSFSGCGDLKSGRATTYVVRGLVGLLM